MGLSAHTVVHKQVLRYKSNSLQNQMLAYGTLSRSIDLLMRNKGGGDWTSPSERGKKGEGNIIYCLWNVRELVWGKGDIYNLPAPLLSI